MLKEALKIELFIIAKSISIVDRNSVYKNEVSLKNIFNSINSHEDLYNLITSNDYISYPKTYFDLFKSPTDRNPLEDLIGIVNYNKGLNNNIDVFDVNSTPHRKYHFFLGEKFDNDLYIELGKCIKAIHDFDDDLEDREDTYNIDGFLYLKKEKIYNKCMNCHTQTDVYLCIPQIKCNSLFGKHCV